MNRRFVKWNKYFVFGILLLMVSGGFGCKFFTPSSKPSKKGLIYFYDEMIGEEAAGKPAIPVGETWTNYWSTRFELLRSESTADRNYEDVIQHIKAARGKAGLPPVE